MSIDSFKEITPQEVQQLLQKNAPVTVLDVREPGEWVAGHIEGAQHIPLGQLMLQLSQLSKEKAYIVVCRSGGRSGLACEFLQERGFDVTNMLGGLMSWDAELVSGY